MASKESIWSVPFALMMAMNFFSAMAAYIINATLPVYVDSLGASAAIVGFIFGAFSVSAILIRPFAGPAFDSFSRKKMLLGALALSVVAISLYALFDSVSVILVARMLQGLTIGCSGPLAMALVSECLPAHKLASGISIYALSQTIAQVIGPAIGLWLMEIMGFTPTFFTATAMIALSFVCVLPLKEPERELLPYRLAPSRMFAKEALPSGFLLLLVGMPYAVMNSYIVLYGYMLGIENVSMFFIVYALGLVATRPLFGKFADSFGTPKLIAIAIICYMVANALIFGMRDFTGMIIAALVSSAGFGASSPLIQSLALSSVPIERRGAASNTAYCGMDFSMLVGPSIAGIVIELLQGAMGSTLTAYSSMWLTMLVPLAIALVIIVAVAKKRKVH